VYDSNYRATFCVTHKAVAFLSKAVSLWKYKASVSLAQPCERAVFDSLSLAPEQDRRLSYRATFNLANLGASVYGQAMFFEHFWKAAMIRDVYQYRLHV
jgi:hypothetical protein